MSQLTELLCWTKHKPYARGIQPQSTPDKDYTLAITFKDNLKVLLTDYTLGNTCKDKYKLLAAKLKPQTTRYSMTGYIFIKFSLLRLRYSACCQEFFKVVPA